MSLSSFLLGKHQSKGQRDILDGDLDTLFRSSVSTPTKQDAPFKSVKSSGIKRRRGAGEDTLSLSVKRKKSSGVNEQASIRTKLAADPVAVGIKKVEGRKGRQVSKMVKRKNAVEESDEEVLDTGLEEAYERRTRPGKQATVDSSKIEEQPNATSDSEADVSKLSHETAVEKNRRGKTRTRHVHHGPSDETEEQRHARTIFLGNIPIETAKSRSALKHLRQHILSHVPGAKIESTRFRSVAFQQPTSATPAPRTHSLERTAEWRVSKGDGVPMPQPRLSSHDKKRIAFIKNKLHAEADSVTVYVVFAYGAELAPDEAARTAVAAIDNTEYMGRTLRADIVGDGVGDPKRTVFVGSLDFASREEDLRAFFEGVVSAERGPRSAVSDSGSDNREEKVQGTKPKTWVTRVRIVRDKDTQLGKGFAYVQFADRECVDEILALEPGKLKFAKRKLRVERCKTLPRSSNTSSKPSATATVTHSSTKTRSGITHSPTKLTPTAIPKGDPNLGAHLAHLSKIERKAAKAVDPTRVARRLAKKKARSSLPVPEQRKDRVRVRKSTAERKNAGVAAHQKKSRVRSEHSVARRNTKK